MQKHDHGCCLCKCVTSWAGLTCATEVCTKGTLRHEPTFSAVHLQRANQYASVPKSSDCKQKQKKQSTSVVLKGQPSHVSFYWASKGSGCTSLRSHTNFRRRWETLSVLLVWKSSEQLLHFSAMVLRVSPQCITHVQYNYCLRMHLSRIYYLRLLAWHVSTAFGWLRSILLVRATSFER